ncbi:hypothetical protein HUJ04_011457 [Dendroctonus ponderosae]|nr:hypothetical protein HUJ04_011457 [Dendroctonus ponderosae]
MAVENPEELYRLAQEESRSFEQKCAEPVYDFLGSFTAEDGTSRRKESAIKHPT